MGEKASSCELRETRFRNLEPMPPFPFTLCSFAALLVSLSPPPPCPVLFVYHCQGNSLCIATECTEVVGEAFGIELAVFSCRDKLCAAQQRHHHHHQRGWSSPCHASSSERHGSSKLSFFLFAVAGVVVVVGVFPCSLGEVKRLA